MHSDGMMAMVAAEGCSPRGHPAAALPGASLGGINVANPDGVERTTINLVANFISQGD